MNADVGSLGRERHSKRRGPAHHVDAPFQDLGSVSSQVERHRAGLVHQLQADKGYTATRAMPVAQAARPKARLRVKGSLKKMLASSTATIGSSEPSGPTRETGPSAMP